MTGHTTRHTTKPSSSIETFLELDIRVGKIISAELNPRAKKPAYKIRIDFGTEIGIKHSSAQLVQNYRPDELIDRQIVAVVNLPARNIAGYNSEVLILAALFSDTSNDQTENQSSLALLQTYRAIPLGSPIG